VRRLAQTSRRCLASASLAAALLLVLAAPAIAADTLPDLGMAHPSDLHIDNNTIAGHRLLRYTAVIVNVGSGRFEVHGDRTSTTSPMVVTQRIYNDTGGYRDVSTAAEMFYSGDGHNHWHVEDLETGELIRTDNGVKLGSLAKHGFCFYDNVAYRLGLPGAPSSPFYTSCGTASSLHITPGLSVGWGDKYPWNVAYQYIDIAGVGNGRYRLEIGARTEPQGFVESDYSNNKSWVDIRLKGNSAKILSYGPAA
jgi:Lysyl oxidase